MRTSYYYYCIIIIYKQIIIEKMTWVYLPLLNQCITILLTIALGYLFGRVNVFDASLFIPQTVKFVFYVALPFLVVLGLGVNINFYEDEYVWSFIGAFFLLRLFALLIGVVISISFNRVRNDDSSSPIGQVAVLWLCLSWISTVILGAPILTAVFGDKVKGISYGILAAISSFAFQLPIQMMLLEYHKVQRDGSSVQRDADDNQNTANEEEGVEIGSKLQQSPKELQKACNKIRQDCEVENWNPAQTSSPVRRSFKIPCLVFHKMTRNPVLWGIAGGFILSLSTLGPLYLKKSNIYGDWFISLADWLGACVSPISLFTMGVWISSQRNFLCKISPITIILCMISKLVIMPLMMIGISKAFSLNDEAGRAAVLIACLPISMASFTLGNRFEIGEDLLSMNVILGTVLILPTVIIWNIVMDSLNLYTEYIVSPTDV